IINKELTEGNHPIFFNDNEDHSSNEISSNSNQEKEGPPQDSDIRQLIREECCIEVCKEQKQNMKNTILELVEICRQKEFYCMHDNEVKNVVEQPAERRTRIEKSLQNFKVIHKSFISLNNTSQISPVHAVAPILSTKEPEYSPSIGENEVTSEDKRECDMPVCENSPICDNHSEIFSDSNNDDDISSDEDAFEDIGYVEASLPDPEINKSDNSLSDNFSPEFETFCDHTEEMKSGNTTTHADNSLPEYDSFCFEIEPDQERLINAVMNNISDNSTNDPLLEEVDLFLASDNSILQASDFDKPSFPRPPPEPPDDEFDLEPEVISSVIKNIDELNEDECFDPGGEIDVSTNNENVNYFPFIFVIRIFLPYLIYPEVFPLFLSAESEDIIFDPGFTPHRLMFLVFRVLSRSARASHPFFEISLGKSISLISIA
nr:hypothetical protein [Tanacetum cinerariifolium]